MRTSNSLLLASLVEPPAVRVQVARRQNSNPRMFRQGGQHNVYTSHKKNGLLHPLLSFPLHTSAEPRDGRPPAPFAFFFVAEVVPSTPSSTSSPIAKTASFI